MAQLFGRQANYEHQRRCDFCKRPVKNGYLVNQGPTQGFFCGRRCLESATRKMKDIKTKEGIK